MSADDGRGTSADSGSDSSPPPRSQRSSRGDAAESSVTQAPTHYRPEIEAAARQRSTRKAAFTPGSFIAGRYEILELLAEGGMGEVYRARDRELDKVIALKTLRGKDLTDHHAQERLKRELLLAREVAHPNVVRIYDLGEDQGIKFFTMELVEGQDLKEYLLERRRLSAREAVSIGVQILAALQEAHKQGVIHRDLKPQNVMIEPDGTPRLMDFGIARSSSMTAITATGSVIGTPDYMSPEQVQGEKAGPRSDLYSFGIILYEMLTGDLPYTAETPLASAVARLTRDPARPRTREKEIPEYLERTVLKCMERDPALRYQSAQEVLDDLASQRFTPITWRQRLERMLTRNRAALLVATLLILLAAGASYVALQRVGPGKSESRTGPVAEEGPVATLAILPLTNVTGETERDWMRSGLAQMLVSDLSQSRYVRPLPTPRVFQILRDLGVEEQHRFDAATLDAVSEDSGADLVLTGQFAAQGATVRLDLELREALTGLTHAFGVQSEKGDVFALVDEITERLKERLDLTPQQLRNDPDRPIAAVTSSSLEAMEAYQVGLERLRVGAVQKAVDSLRRATLADPGFAMASAKLAEAYLAAGRDHDAQDAIERAVLLSEKVPLPLPEQYYIQATAARVAHDFERAAKAYTELTRLYPRDPDLHLSLAAAYEELGHFPEAARSYRRVLDLEPGYGEARFGLAWSLLMVEGPERCIQLLQEDLKSERFSDDLHSMGMLHSILGTAYRELYQNDTALEHYAASLSFRKQAGDLGGQAVTLGNMSTVYKHLGQMDRAIEAERQALEIARELGDREQESNYLLEMGRTFKIEGRLEEALEAFRSSLVLEEEREDHDNMANRLNLIGDVYRQMGEYGSAMVHLKQAAVHLTHTEKRIESGINSLYQGMVQRAQGSHDDALQSLHDARGIFTEIGEAMGAADTQLQMAAIYRSQGRYSDAYDALLECRKTYVEIEAEHDLASIRPLLAHALIDLGRLDEARSELELMHEEAHHDGRQMPETLLARARLASLRGSPEEAAASYWEANKQANLSRRWEIAVESRIALGRLYLQEDRRYERDGERAIEGNAVGILEKAHQQARKWGLRPLEAEAAVALARVHLHDGDWEAALDMAENGMRIAKRYDGHPVLHRAATLRGEALSRLGRHGESEKAWARAATELEWMRVGLRKEHVEAFMARPQVQAFLEQAVPILERGGRQREASGLRRWLVRPQAVARESRL